MIISVFSPVWYAVMGGYVLCILVLTALLKNKSREKKLLVMEILSIASCVWWIIYKVILYTDPQYEFILANELPLYLCNIALPVSVFAAKKDSRVLQSFLFYGCTLGALMACLTPAEEFCNVPLYLPRCICYWGCHGMVFVLGIGFVTCGLCRPRIRDIGWTCLLLLCVAVLDHVCNALLRATVSETANYSYTYGIEGNPVCELLMKLIPVPCLYLVPAVIPLSVVNVLMYLLTRIGKKKELSTAKTGK